MHDSTEQPCTICKKLKDLKEFHENPFADNGKKVVCKGCQREICERNGWPTITEEVA